MEVWDTRKLRQARSAVDLKAKDVAEQADITPQYLSGIESGKYQPSSKLVSKLSAIYQMPIAYFLSTENKSELSA